MSSRAGSLCRAPRGHGSRFRWLDTGIGIGKNDQARVFEEFEQINAGPRGDSMNRGTGLGLPISRRLGTLARWRRYRRERAWEGLNVYGLAAWRSVAVIAIACSSLDWKRQSALELHGELHDARIPILRLSERPRIMTSSTSGRKSRSSFA